MTTAKEKFLTTTDTLVEKILALETQFNTAEFSKALMAHADVVLKVKAELDKVTEAIATGALFDVEHGFEQLDNLSFQLGESKIELLEMFVAAHRSHPPAGNYQKAG